MSKAPAGAIRGHLRPASAMLFFIAQSFRNDAGAWYI